MYHTQRLNWQLAEKLGMGVAKVISPHFVISVYQRYKTKVTKMTSGHENVGFPAQEASHADIWYLFVVNPNTLLHHHSSCYDLRCHGAQLMYIEVIFNRCRRRLATGNLSNMNEGRLSTEENGPDMASRQ